MNDTDTDTDTDTDVVREFTRALPRHLAQHLNVTDRVTALIHVAARDHGWTVPQLVEECSRDTDGIYKPGGLITSRLEGCAQHPPVGKKTSTTRPFCTPECAERRGQIEDPKTGLPIGRCECRSGT